MHTITILPETDMIIQAPFAAVFVPPSATAIHCTVSWPRVVVTVICGEHHAVLVAE